MKTYEMVNKVIDKIVLYFNENEITVDFIKKIREMECCGDVTIDGNNIRCVSNNQVREINVDYVNQTIDLNDYGERITYDKHTSFSNNIHYYENGNKCNCYKKTINNELIQLENKTIISSNIYNNTIIMNNGKRTFTGIVKSCKYAEKNKYGEYTVLKNDDSKKDFYLLANGDILKIVNNNDKERYFYCDSSFMPGNQEGTNSSINVELSYYEAENILKNFENAFYLINNDTIFNIRGMSY